MNLRDICLKHSCLTTSRKTSCVCETLMHFKQPFKKNVTYIFDVDLGR